jgi:hypothetical protein
MPLPEWLPPAKPRSNWETTSWARTGQDLTH